VQVIAKQFASTTDYLLLKVFGVPAKLAPGGHSMRSVDGRTGRRQ
jgi:hypothetical protein